MFLVLALMPALAGCASSPVGTASGKPDVTMMNINEACFREHLVNGAIDKGWTIRQATETQIVMQRPAPATAGVFLLTALGTRGRGGLPDIRITMTLVPSNGGLRVVADGVWVINPGRGVEEYTQNGKFNAEDQAALQAAARRAEEVCRKA